MRQRSPAPLGPKSEPGGGSGASSWRNRGFRQGTACPRFHSTGERGPGQRLGEGYFCLGINEFNSALDTARQRAVYSVYVVEVYGVYMRRITTSVKIARAARRLLDEDGPDGVTMRRVAKAVRMTPMALYRHFPDRAGMLNALADAGFEDFADRLSGAPSGGSWEARITWILDRWLDFALENPQLFELMFLRRRTGARRFPEDFRAGLSPTANVMDAAIEEGMRRGLLRDDDAWEITFEMGALLQGLLMLYLGGRISGTDGDFRALCHRSLRRYLDGILA